MNDGKMLFPRLFLRNSWMRGFEFEPVRLAGGGLLVIIYDVLHPLKNNSIMFVFSLF